MAESRPLSTQELILGLAGLILIPTAVGNFVFIKEEATISVQSCDTIQGRRGDTDRIITADGEELQIWPEFLGGPDRSRALERLCRSGSAQVTIRGARLEALPFIQRVIFEVD